MTDSNPPPALPDSARQAKAWLDSLGNGATPDATGELLQQVRILRERLTGERRAALLELLYPHLERTAAEELPRLEEMPLPVAAATRQRCVTLQALFAAVADMYLAGLSDSQRRIDDTTALSRVIRACGWHISISHLIAAPPQPGIWRQLHAAYRLARKLGIAGRSGAAGGSSVEGDYVRILMAGIAQPASFSAGELALVSSYVAHRLRTPELSEIPPKDRSGVFWIDLNSDVPAHALSRRLPTNDVPALYFVCDLAARNLLEVLQRLHSGTPAAELNLPPLAETPGGQGALRRLADIWGNPAKRKFPRRRQSYRVDLCAGVEQLWHILRHTDRAADFSEWMVTNESPDGFLLMHVSGPTGSLGVGDVVAIRPRGERAQDGADWHVSIVRWAVSENPEHIEIGLQQIATRALAATVVRPMSEADGLAALLLPEMPPLRDTPALLAETGKLGGLSSGLLLLIDHASQNITEVRPLALTEQTSRIEVFSVVPNEKP